MTTMDTRIDVRLPGDLVKRAAVSGFFRPDEPRAMVVRFALLRLLPGIDDSQALSLARPNAGGRKKQGMAPADDRVGVPMSTDHLEQIQKNMPDGVINTSQMTRYALYRMQGWGHDDALECARDFAKRAGKTQAA